MYIVHLLMFLFKYERFIHDFVGFDGCLWCLKQNLTGGVVVVLFKASIRYDVNFYIIIIIIQF